MDERKFLFAYDRRRTSTLTLDEQPGAHTGSTRKYIPGYSDANIIYRAPTTGSDSNDGLTELTPKQTKSACDTAAGTTKKIRIIEACTLNENIEKPTEMKRGVSGTISSSLTAPVDTLTMAGATAFTTGSPSSIVWSPELKKLYAVSGTEVASSADGITYVVEGTLGFGATKALWTSHNKTLIIAGALGRVAYSTNGSDYTTVQLPTTSTLRAIIYSDIAGGYIAAGDDSYTFFSADGITWERSSLFPGGFVYSMVEAFGEIIACDSVGKLATTKTGLSWETYTDPIASGYAIRAAIYMPTTALLIVGDDNGEIWSAPDLVTFTSRLSATATIFYDAAYSAELGAVVVCGQAKQFYRSYNGTSYTDAATNNYTAGDEIRGVCFSPLLGQCFSTGGNAGGTQRRSAYCPAFANTISASIAGFTVQAMQYSGTVTAYNCTLRQPGTTAALTLDACRVNYDSHISNNAAKSRATLYRGNRHTTCTPAAQNDIDMNLDTVGGTWYIYNASQTGYERIRDCIVEGGIVASYPVTVSGRANTRGTSENVLFGATVTHNDPKFVDETDYNLQYQTNGYDKNSPMAGRSAIYFNSSGGARDIGAWSYIESAVSYYYAKSRYLYKGSDISHGLEFNLTEQQGDSGVMNVYGNTQRIKEVLTMQYGSTQEEERAVFYEMLTLKDKGVKITFAEWQDNTGTVTVNGNQSSGAEFLTVDAVQVFNGMTVTIASKVYSVMRASPNMTAATKLILDRPTTDAVSDNDVLTTNYPSGQGEYQFSGPTNITMKQNASTGLSGWRTGFAIRLIRKYQG